MSGVTRWVGVLAVVSILSAGCSGSEATKKPAAGALKPPLAKTGALPSQGTTSSPDLPKQQPPSAFARTICDQKLRTDVTNTLGLGAVPPVSASIGDHLYTCTYRLPTGRFVLSVKQSADVASAHAYFNGLRQRFRPTFPMRGLASLGLPAFGTADGRTVFLKNEETLQADATGLPPEVGRYHQPRADLAFYIASRVIWPDT